MARLPSGSMWGARRTGSNLNARIRTFHSLCLLAVVAALALSGRCARADEAAPPLEEIGPHHPHILDLLSKLTLSEKLSMLHGTPFIRGYTGYVEGVPRLGIPPLRMNDGPQGFRGPAGKSTAWPCGLSLASTFSPDLVHQAAHAFGEEFAIKGANVFLGPGLNIMRVPHSGRTFEYLTGEDPTLGESLAEAFVRGIQAVRGVVATSKHFINNDQETSRNSIDAIVDETTNRNLYMRPFRAAVRAGSKCVMCSYNKINGRPGCGSNETLERALKEEFRFHGLVMSDWFATRDTVDSLNNGLDIEMPIPLFFADPLVQRALEEKRVKLAKIDEKVRRILWVMKSGGLLANATRPAKQAGSPSTDATSESRARLARHLVAHSTILLKNLDAALPLTRLVPESRIVVVGDRAKDRPIAVGGGSGHVTPKYISTVFEAVKHRHGLNTLYVPSNKVKANQDAIRRAHLVLVVAGAFATEGRDRPDLSVDEPELVSQTLEMNPNCVLVLIAPGPILIPWADHPHLKAILLQFLPGQEHGNGLSDVLFGAVNPTARLPLSLPAHERQYNFTEEQFPGREGRAVYTEKEYVGYKLLAKLGERPRYAFGFGLSYGPAIRYLGAVARREAGSDRVVVHVVLLAPPTLTIVGDRFEIVQVYHNAALDESDEDVRVNSLVGFRRVRIPRVGGWIRARVAVPRSALERWSSAHRKWVLPKQPLDLRVGSSSDNLPLRTTVTMMLEDEAAMPRETETEPSRLALA